MRRSILTLLLLTACAPAPLDPVVATDRIDPTEPLPAPGARRSLVLTTTTLVHTDPTTITVTGLDPSETVHIVRGGSEGPGPCPAPLGGLCLDIATSAGVLGTAVADAGGVAALTVALPATLAGRTLVLQPVAARGPGGSLSVKGAAVSGVVLDPGVDLDGDGFDSHVDCDDADAGVFPGALELCDGVDNDCDPITGEDGLISANAWNYATVADAVAASLAGGEVTVCGTVTSPDTLLVTSDLTLRGLGPDASALEHTGVGFGIEVDGALLTVEGLTVTGADSGITMTSGADLVLADVVLADHPGDALQVAWTASTVTLLDSTVRDNGAGVTFDGTTMTVERSTFADNGSWGLYVQEADVEVTDSTFVGNHPGITQHGCSASWCGGDPGFSDLILTTSSVISNPGGGVEISGSSTLTVTDCDFGVGATENGLYDVSAIDGGPADYGAYQAASTFTCTSTSCL